MVYNFKINISLVLASFCWIFTFSQSDDSITYANIETGIANYLVEIGYFKEIKESRTNSNKIRLSGFFNEITDKDSIPNGVYKYSTRSSHGIYLFVVVEENNYKILNLYDKKELFRTLNEILNFSIKRDYCKEVVIEYIESALHWHFLMQNYGRSDCSYSFDNKTTSSLSLEELKNKLVNHLKSENVIGDENFHILMLDKIDEFNLTISLNPLNENDAFKNLNKGYYRFTATDNMKYAVSYYLLLNDNDYELVLLKEGKNFNQELFTLLHFGIDQKFCSEIIKYVISNYLKQEQPLKSCLTDLKKRLP